MPMASLSEIVSVLGLRNVRQNGDEVICSCPFTQNHRRGDSRPSFGFNIAKGVGLCRGCGWTGTLVSLAEQVLNISRFEAVNTIYHDMNQADVVRLMAGGVAVLSNEKTRYKNDDEYLINEWKNGDRTYWHNRGFTDETIGKWQLGYDFESKRAVVPIYFENEFAGWSKRAISDDVFPKWLHSRGLERNRVLFGKDNFSSDTCILVEAPLSVIMLDQRGHQNVIASFGASLSDEQAMVIRNSYNKVIVWYDPDDAGYNGTDRAICKLAPYLDVYIMQPVSDDPAGISADECEQAFLNPLIPAWAWEMQRR